ncbi:MAG: NADH-quinone oxidoreductase subunit NuoK [Planctomycetota bacterium]|nr:MAG: NADH-quinone oxidoreductase subunit NuoK [Planctomycetota bacterium]
MIPPPHVYTLAVLLFGLGVFGFLRHRNAIMLLMSVELMLNSANLSFLAAARAHGDSDGAMMPMFLIVVAAAEAAVGLALILILFRKRQTLDIEVPRSLKD